MGRIVEILVATNAIAGIAVVFGGRALIRRSRRRSQERWEKWKRDREEGDRAEG